MSAKPTRTHHQERQLRAAMGLHLRGPMPTIKELAKRYQLSQTAAQHWHASLVNARREFGVH